jgi:hypothetical protein
MRPLLGLRHVESGVLERRSRRRGGGKAVPAGEDVEHYACALHGFGLWGETPDVVVGIGIEVCGFLSVDEWSLQSPTWIEKYWGGFEGDSRQLSGLRGIDDDAVSSTTTSGIDFSSECSGKTSFSSHGSRGAFSNNARNFFIVSFGPLVISGFVFLHLRRLSLKAMNVFVMPPTTPSSSRRFSPSLITCFSFRDRYAFCARRTRARCC